MKQKNEKGKKTSGRESRKITGREVKSSTHKPLVAESKTEKTRRPINPADLLIGFVLGAILTLLIVNYRGQNNKVSDNPDPTSTSANTAAQAGKTNIDDDAILGDKSKTKVAIVEFSDFECPFCQKYHNETFGQIKTNFIDNGKIVYVRRDYPLSFHDPAATTDANAAECVKSLSDSVKYFDYANLIFQNTGLNGTGVANDKLVELAGQLGLNQDDFRKCIDEKRFESEIKKDLNDGTQAGIQGTPNFIVGKLSDNGDVEGEVVSGAQPYATFEQAINKYSN